MLSECVVALNLDQFADRVRAVLVVLAQNRARLGLEVLDGVLEVLKTVRLDLENLLEIGLRERGVVVRVVVGGVGVLPRARLGENRFVLGRRVLLGAAEHHVLEEVSKAGLARLDLVPRPGLHRNLKRDDVRKSCRDDDDLEAVVEHFLRRLEWKDVTLLLLGRCKQRREKEEREDEKQASFHTFSWGGEMKDER